MFSASILFLLIHLLFPLALAGVVFHPLSRHAVGLALLPFKLLCIFSCEVSVDFGTAIGLVAMHGGLGKQLDNRVAPE